MSETRSFGTQCQSRKSTAMQTKRLSKEELRYYTKIVDKEKQVLLNFIKATKEYPAIRQPHYKINLLPLQTKPPKNVRKKRRTKVRKHSSNKMKQVSGKTKEFDQENSVHYVSKIVVDDATHCLKLRVRSCNPKKGSKQPELKENNMASERARARKGKQPRRFTRDSDCLAIMENHEKEMENISPEEIVGTRKPLKQNRVTPSPPERIMNDEMKPLDTKPPKVKAEVENTDCLFANTKSPDRLSSPTSSPLPTMTSQFSPILSPDEDSSERQATSDDDDSNYHSANEDNDDNESVCSEEFSIVEPHKGILDDGNEQRTMNDKTTAGESEMRTTIKQTDDTNMKDELKKRLRDNLSRKGNAQYDNMARTQGDMAGRNMAGSKGDMAGRNVAGTQGDMAGRNMAGSKDLPQVVSVHFYDAQTHSQQVLGPETHVTRYPTYPLVRDPMTPSTTLPQPTISPLSHMPRKPSSTTLTTSRPITPQAYLPRIPPMNYPYPSYYPNTTEINKQPPAYRIPGIPPQTLPPPNITTRGNASFNATVPTQVRPHHPEILTNSMTTRGVESSRVSVSTEVRSHHPEILTHSATSGGVSIPSTSVPTDTWQHHPETLTNGATSRGVSHHPEKATYNTTIRGVASSHVNNEPKETEEPEMIEIDMRGKKRKRFIFGAHEPPKKKVISSLLTPLCEREATRLADGIHEINMQYFPLRSLAQKAANRVSGDTDDVLKLIEQKMQLKTKIQDVEKARNLLKDIYDMVLKSKEIEDIQNFELVSHNFGVRNILNHLSLVDLYFGELGSELQSKI